MVRLSREARHRLDQGIAAGRAEHPPGDEALGASIVLLEEQLDSLDDFQSVPGERHASAVLGPPSSKPELNGFRAEADDAIAAEPEPDRFRPEADVVFAAEPEPDLSFATNAAGSDAGFSLPGRETSWLRSGGAIAAAILLVAATGLAAASGLLGTTASGVLSAARSGDWLASLMRRVLTEDAPGQPLDRARLGARQIVPSATASTVRPAGASKAWHTTADLSRPAAVLERTAVPERTVVLAPTPVPAPTAVPGRTAEPTTRPAEVRQPLAVRAAPETPPPGVTGARPTVDLPALSAGTPVASAPTIAQNAPPSPSATEAPSNGLVAPLDARPPASAAPERIAAPPPERVAAPPSERVAESPRSTGTAGAGAANSVNASATGETPAIQLVLGRYQTAFNDRNASIAKSVWPSLDEKKLARAFNQVERQEVAFDRCQIKVAGLDAVASCAGHALYVAKVGNRAQRVEPRTWTFKLKYTGQGWLIAGVEAS